MRHVAVSPSRLGSIVLSSCIEYNERKSHGRGKDQQWLLPPSVKRGKRALNVWATLCATTFFVLTVMNGTQKNLIDLVLLIVLMAAAIVTTIVVFTTDGVSVKGGARTGSIGLYVLLLFVVLCIFFLLGFLGWGFPPKIQALTLTIGNFVALFTTHLASRALENIACDGSLRREESSS